MLSRRVHVLFARDEYERLKRLARKEHKTIGSLIRESVARVYLGRMRPSFGKLKAFGIWKERPETDDDLLASLPGRWDSIPTRNR